MNEKQVLNLTIICNISAEPFLTPCIRRVFEQNGIYVRTFFVNYMDLKSANISDIFADSNLIIVILNFENDHPEVLESNVSADIDRIINTEIEKARHLQKYLQEHTSAPIIWFGYEDFQWNATSIFGYTYVANGLVDRINNLVQEELIQEITYVDTKRLISSVGKFNAYSNKNKYRWNYPYSKMLSEKIGKEIYKQYLISYGISKKCIVLDCDNVLWGGIISEEGIENIRLGNFGIGKSYVDFQKFLLMLHDHGVILTVCSKNNENDIINVFRNHSEMVLCEDDIACFRINWNTKAENVCDIASTLNIGLDSMVYIDDSSFEIGMIRELLPEVAVIHFDIDGIYEELALFNLKQNTDVNAVKQRHLTYRADEFRREAKEYCETIDEYLSSLKINVDIHKASPIEYARISELTQRTNRMTNGVRYTVEELKEYTKNPEFNLYSVSVSDRFSNLGIVGAFAVEKDILQLFSLSCRALDRKIEISMLDTIKKLYNVTCYQFIGTQRNDAVKLLLNDLTGRNECIE